MPSQYSDYRHGAYHLAFYVDVGDLNSCLYQTIYPTEPCLQSPRHFSWVHTQPCVRSVFYIRSKEKENQAKIYSLEEARLQGKPSERQTDHSEKGKWMP